MRASKDSYKIRLLLMLAALVLVIVLIFILATDSDNVSVSIETAHTNDNINKPLVTKEEVEFSQEVNSGETTQEETDPVVYLENDPIDAWHDMQTSLRESNNANDLLIAALFAKGSGAMGANDLNLTEELLLRAFELQPDNILVLLQIDRFCTTNAHFSICGLPYLEKMAQLGANNSLILMQVASTYYKNSDMQRALAFMQKAAMATSSISYYPDYLQAIDQAFIAHGNRGVRGLRDITFYTGLTAAIGMPDYRKFLEICRERVMLSVQGWKEACRDTGKVIAASSQTEVDKMVGYGIQYRYSDLTEAGIETLMDERRAEVKAWYTDNEQSVFNAEFFEKNPNPEVDNDLWNAFLDMYKAAGERSALSFLYQSLTSE